MSRRKALVMEILQEQRADWATPTEIGMAMGFTYDCASSSVARALKSLVADGLVEKDGGRGRYRWRRTKGARP